MLDPQTLVLTDCTASSFPAEDFPSPLGVEVLRMSKSLYRIYLFNSPKNPQ